MQKRIAGGLRSSSLDAVSPQLEGAQPFALRLDYNVENQPVGLSL